jgi:DNA-binding MarR family transcriptional regulator
MNAGTRLDCLAEFTRMWEIWRSILPDRLRREDAGVLLRFLQLTESKDIFQTELKSQLGVNQPRLSKLTQKLVEEGWIKLERPVDDGRKRRAVLTSEGRSGLAVLRAKLQRLPPTGPAKSRRKSPRKGIQRVAGQMDFEIFPEDP